MNTETRQYARKRIDEARRNFRDAHATLMRAVAQVAKAERQQLAALDAKDKARAALETALEELYAQRSGRQKDIEEAGIW